MIGGDGSFTNRGGQLGALSLRHALPTIYQFREFAAGGGLMSYGGSNAASYRLAGVYTGRVLKGEKPADFPIGWTLLPRSATPPSPKSPKCSAEQFSKRSRRLP